MHGGAHAGCDVGVEKVDVKTHMQMVLASSVASASSASSRMLVSSMKRMSKASRSISWTGFGTTGYKHLAFFESNR
jgi:hypothetical protein